MLNSEVLDLIQGRLGNRTGSVIRTKVLSELNEKIRQLELRETLPWFLEDIWEPTAIASQDYIALPSDFLRLNDETNVEVRNTTITPPQWSKLVKVSYAKLREETANAEAQLPAGFAFYGERMYLGPTPDTTYAFRVPYFKRTAPLVDNSSAVSNKWLLEFFNYVTLDTIMFLAKTHLRDVQLQRNIVDELRDARAGVILAVEARLHAGREYLLDDVEN